MRKIFSDHRRIAQTLACCVFAFSLAFLAACSRHSDAQSGSSSNKTTSFTPQPYGGKLETDDGQWIRPAKDFASTRYSTLDQINRSNVSQLKLAWTFLTGTLS